MADLFTMQIDLGPDAALSVLATAVADLQDVTDSAMDLAIPVADAQARRSISNIVTEQGFRGLAALIRTRELPTTETLDRDVAYLDDAAQELDLMAREFGFLRSSSRRYRYSALVAGLLQPGWSSGSWTAAPFEAPLRQLLAAETAERLPREGCRVRSLSYENPITAELVMASGAASMALGYLLTVIVSLGPRRRREIARADAEERIQGAHARDVEDLIERRIQLRRLMLGRIARGEIDLRPEDITEALLDKVVGAADRLAERELTFERRELPS